MNRRVYFYTYSNRFDPSMPVVEVGISLLRQSHPTITVPALIDSGSDASMLPLSVLEGIGAKPIDTVRVRGILGQSFPLDLYSVRLYIGPHRLSSVEIAGAPSEEECLLGRNVLNRLEIVLNGPASTTGIYE